MVRLHNKKASATVLSTVLALVITVVGAGLLVLMLYMGGQREVKNAVDAGCLNIGKQVIDNIFVNVSQNAEPERWFNDVLTDKDYCNTFFDDGKVNLRRINRVWAKAMLVQMNSDAASREGLAGSCPSSAAAAYNGAQSLSRELSNKLNHPPFLYQFFLDLAQQNSVRMLGTTATLSVVPDAGWQTSLLERSKESNIILPGRPPDFSQPSGILRSQNYTTCTRTPVPSGANGLYFLKGYTPLFTDGPNYWQVPFLYAEKPHSISSTTFDANKLTTLPLGWQSPVPNAFSAHGKAEKAGVAGEQAMSWVITNPRQTFRMAMPHSFLRIRIDENKAHWYFYPWGPGQAIEYGGEQTAMPYGYMVQGCTGPGIPQGGILCSWVIPQNVVLGMDVAGRTLDELIFGIPRSPWGDEAKLETYMVNRINQMYSKVPTGASAGDVRNAGDLHSVLSNAATIGHLLNGQRDFYLFSTDGTNLVVEPRDIARMRAPWLNEMINSPAEGVETRVVRDAQSTAPIFFLPQVIPLPWCHPVVASGTGDWHKEVYWRPGTGFRGCLGDIRSKRWTNVYSLGICSP